MKATETTRVLLIEDDGDFANLVRLQLSRTKPRLDLTGAVNLESGRQRLIDGAYDAVLLDLNLPDSDGLDTLRQVYALVPEVPIIVMTASDDDDLAIELLRNGAQEYLVKKDKEVSRLHRTIRTAIERKSTYVRLRLQESHQREDFIAMLAHDLKTPVSGANRIYDLLLEGWLGPLSPGQIEIMAKLKESNTSLLRLIQNMLEVYGFEQSTQTLSQQDVNLLPLLVDCILHSSETARRNQIEIKSMMPDHIGTMYADPNAIRRLILNVIDNAIKFSPAGRTVTVLATSDTREAVITIADQGPGIPMRHQEKLFERFFQGGPDTKYTAATGLGLYLCRRIAHVHGGSITCQSEEGRGTSFIIKLPLLEKSAPTADGLD